MTVESVTYIEDLDEDYPAEGEVGTLHEGNDHIRNIKKAVKNSWAFAVQTTPSATYTWNVPSTGPYNIWKFGAGYTGNVWEIQNSSSQRVSSFDASDGTLRIYGGYTSEGGAGVVVSAGAGTLTNFVSIQADASNSSYIRVSRQSTASTAINPYEYSSPNTTELFYVSSTGQVAGTGAFLELSDLRDKDNVLDCTAGLDAIMALRPVTFEYLVRPGQVNYGFIAQEVQKILPEVVADFSEDRLGIAYEQILAPLVKAVQELAERVARLEG